MVKPIQRLKYHNGLFLEEDEFILEQYYHLMMRCRLNYALFTPGVLYGLKLNYSGGVLTVTPGLAIDQHEDPDYGMIGREIVVLGSPVEVDLGDFPDGGDEVWITIKYKDEATDPKDPTNEPSRITETYEIEPHGTPQEKGTDKILLGKFIVDTGVDLSVAQQKALLKVGAALPLPTIASINPDNGDQDAMLTGVEITGINLTGTDAVTFDPPDGLTVSNVIVADDERVTFDLAIDSDATAGARNFRVDAPGGTAQSEDFGLSFSVNPGEPVITGINPNSGDRGAMLTGVEITGINLTGTDAVTFDPPDGLTVSNVRVVDDGHVTFNLAIGSGASAEIRNFRVSAPGGTAQSEDFGLSFSVNPGVPAITNFTPISGGAGTTVTISGTNFTGATEVTFGGATATSFTVDSDTEITAEVPLGTVTGKIRVTTPGGSAESDADFTFIPAPTITDFTPISGGVGTTVTITGTNFSGTTEVTFGGATASLNVVLDFEITAEVPVDAVTGKIRVTTSGGFAESATNFKVIPAPTITDFTPISGGVGTKVTINGTKFTGATEVTFGGATAEEFTVNSASKITAIVPDDAVTGRIVVTTPGGSAESANNFTVVSAPTITDFTPTSGGVDTTVTISGTNFTGATEVTFGGATAEEFTVNSATQITAIVPDDAVTGKIRVDGPGGFGESAADFTVVPAPVFVTGIPGTPGTEFDPNGGTTGTDILLFGRNFSVDSPTLPTVELVDAGGSVLHAFEVSAVTQESTAGIDYEVIFATVGDVTQAVPTPGKVRVTTSGGFVVSSDTFTLFPS